MKDIKAITKWAVPIVALGFAGAMCAMPKGLQGLLDHFCAVADHLIAKDSAIRVVNLPWGSSGALDKVAAPALQPTKPVQVVKDILPPEEQQPK